MAIADIKSTLIAAAASGEPFLTCNVGRDDLIAAVAHINELEAESAKFRAVFRDLVTVRDHFAGQALQGYLASMTPDAEPAEYATSIAQDAYKLADAMMLARSQ